MFPTSIQNLINILAKLPGLGTRSAGRLAIWLFNQPVEDLTELSEAIINLKKQTRACERCFNFTMSGNNLCTICADQKRDQSLFCVIEDALDIPPIEKTRCFNGVYHILGGAIAPLNGVGPEKLHIKELIERINLQKPAEIILALNPTIEGDTTALYLDRLLKQQGIKISRLGRGLSTGSDLEYTDEATLSNALLNRK